MSLLQQNFSHLSTVKLLVSYYRRQPGLQLTYAVNTYSCEVWSRLQTLQVTIGLTFIRLNVHGR